jgi:TRAP-type C4-dicarboxylate transport system substrate-binding protein
VFQAVKANPVSIDIELLARALEDGSVEIGESTYPRVYSMNQNEVSTVVNDTAHSLFLTSILIGQDFWNSLSPELQEIVQTAATKAAAYERQLSIADIAIVRNKCVADGIKVIDLSDEEKAKFKDVTKSVYTELDSYFTPGLVDKIKQA